ncbi:unnamed protein product [marine sediment metagenome]|uniref:Tyr recombinase domain-containing protein n=1 Tax=marine sediment metagenome TaxID=412755 RepID=X1A5I2_9ZZZZ
MAQATTNAAAGKRAAKKPATKRTRTTKTKGTKAGFDRLYNFHCLRHSAITNVYRATRDLFLAQRFARHSSPLTTTIYTYVSDEEMSDRLRQLRC